MRENLTLVFCLLAGFAVLFGRDHRPPSLTRAYDSFEAALARGDARRAARYGEIALRAAPASNLLDAAGVARLALQVGDAERLAGNSQRANELYASAVDRLNDGAHAAELAEAEQRLGALARDLADRAPLRGTLAAKGKGG